MFRRGNDDLELARLRFDQLVREHHRALHGYVRVLYPDAHAEAVVNSTFAQLWQHLTDVPDEAVRTWLRASARHEVLNASKRERRWYASSHRAAVLGSERPLPPPDLDSSVDLELVIAALATLGAADREVLLMTALEELTSTDLAEILGIQPAAARRRLSRARARLRAAIERDAGSADDERADRWGEST